MMERLGIPISQAHVMGWHNIAVWSRHLGQGSHVHAAMHREEAAYASELHIAAQLADIFDLLNRLRYEILRAKREPKPYPRPWDKNRKKFGKGAIPVSEFEDWYYGGE